MNRRTFIYGAAAAGAAGLSAGAAPDQKPIPSAHKPWPQIAWLDNPIANGLFPLKFQEALPTPFRVYEYFRSYEKETELFSFTPHEWVTDAILIRGFEIKARKPGSADELRGAKLSLYVDGYKSFDGLDADTFMKEGGCAFPLWEQIPPIKALSSSVFRGFLSKDGMMEGRFLGYFLPNKTRFSVKAEGKASGSFSVEIHCDMARYGTEVQA